ncbi:MAG: energy-coupling factor ABC transporter ATP-binding protein [Lachnospiraceae bacterium]|nr:energy-coupling factor ABC transporter ATP-binding protein [Lachnospiraceae bacterium]
MIEINNVNFRYAGSEQAGVKNINLRIPDGECLLLCGASGCGKTTITRLINGLIPHFYKGELSGEVTVNGRKINEQQLYDLAQVVGSVFQNPRSQFFSVDTDGEIVFGPENIGLSKDEILNRKDRVLTELNLRRLMHRSLFELSGGEKQKIACGSVAALLPDIILLDEPSSNLDWDSIKDLANVIGIWKSQGKTVIISEHRLWYLADMIDRAVYMEGGRIAGEWDRDSFLKLTETDLASMELRPVTLEEKYIREFREDGKKRHPEAIKQEDPNPSDIHIRNFYFTYTPPKYLFFKKKLTHENRDICHLRVDSLDVKKGEIIGIIGKNGSGKSTFLRCLCGLEKSCTGRVSISGKEYKGKGLTKICYMVMQDVNHQLFTESVTDEVLLSMKKEDKEEAENILRSLDLYEYRDKHPMALSGGQKQRVAIASALAAEAEMLLFDEPTSGLDYRHMREVAELLKELAGKGKTVFVSTHDPELAVACCDRLVHISDGYAYEK